LLTIICQVCCIPLPSFSTFWCLLPKGENERGVQFFSSPWLLMCTLVICITYILVTLCAAPHRSMDVGEPHHLTLYVNFGLLCQFENSFLYSHI
jgi:hypothetical protein